VTAALRSRFSPPLILGALTVAVGVLVLVGWQLDIAGLKSVTPGLVSMKPNTAVCFILAGISLALLPYASDSIPARWVAQLCAVALALIAVLTLCEFLFGLNFGIDQLLFSEPFGTVGTVAPGRMAPTAAVTFPLLGSMLLLAHSRRTSATVQRLAFIVICMGLLPLIGYFYGATAQVGIGMYTKMAVHTALLFILLGVGVLLLSPSEGLMRLVTGHTRGGWLVRRLVPLIVGIPVLLGWFRIEGERAGYYESALGVALMMMALMLLFSGLIWWTARALNEDDALRRQGEEILHERETRFRGLVESSINAVALHEIVLDAQGQPIDYLFLEANPSFEFHTGMRPADILGKRATEVFPGIEESGLIETYGRVALTGESTSFETYFAPLDRYYHISAYQVAPRQFAALFIDISQRKRAEIALQESEYFFRESQNAGAIGSYKVDFTTGCWESSAVLDRIFGIDDTYSRSVQGWLDLIHPDDRAMMARYLGEEVLGKGTPFAQAYRVVRHNDGETRWVFGRGTLSLADDGQVVSMIGTIQDINERKLIEEELAANKRLLQDITDNSTALIYITDLDGRFLLVNHKSESVLGVPREQLLGQTREVIMPQEFADQHRANDLQVIRTGEPLFIEEQNAEADGAHVYLTAKFPLYDAQGVLYAVGGMSTDITDRIRAEEEVRTLNASLELRVEERTAELATANRELLAVNEELEAFSYSVSHDLKAPLRAIGGLAAALQEDYENRLDDEGKRLLAVIRENALTMAHLINDLLDFSRLSRHDLAKGDLDLGKLIADVWSRLDDDRAGREVTLKVDLLPLAYGDIITMREVVVNLLSNAIKYPRPCAHAQVQVSGREKKGEVIITVTDNGVGFDMAYYHKLFGVFQRLHSIREFEGNGIGLALVKRIIERHGGRVWAEGAVNQGAYFSFSLPKRRTKAHES
jgi:PAS domain S-box-containing protein